MLTTNNTINTPKNPSKYIKKLNIIQLNTSNSDWDTKKYELITTITNLDADITIVSESNAEINNNEKMETRNTMFSNYNLEDKVINNQNKARVSLIIKKEIPYKRCTELESNNNSTIIIKVKEAKSKNMYIIGTYREWRHLGGPNSTSTLGIKLQKERIEQISAMISSIGSLGPQTTIIWGRDLNCDRNPKNDPTIRPDLRVVTPIFNDIITKNGLAQVN